MVLNKKKILIIAVVIILILLILSFFSFLSSRKKEKEQERLPEGRTLEEILKEDLTAPAGTEVNVPKEVINKLTAPKQKKNPSVPEDIMKSLTAPSK